jgi:hypothetical protein
MKNEISENIMTKFHEFPNAISVDYGLLGRKLFPSELHVPFCSYTPPF